MENVELVKLVGGYWEIFTKLSEKRQNLSQLARELGRSPSQVCRQLKILVEKGLVGCEKDKRGRCKYYYLANEAGVIIKEVMALVKFKPKGKLEEWQIEGFLSILENENLINTLRDSFAESFASICREYPLEVVSYPRVRELFEKVIEGKLDDHVAVKLRSCAPYVFRYVSRNKSWIEWMNKKIYPLLESKLGACDKQARLFAINAIGEIAVNSVVPSLRSKAERRLHRVWYSSDTDSSSDVGVEVLKWLVLLSSKWVFDDAVAKLKDDRYKNRAELLIERLKGMLMPK